MVSYSSKRAKRVREQREKVFGKVVEKSIDGKVRAADFVGNKGTKKFLKVAGERLEVDVKKISEEAGWDGIHGVITNNTRASATTVLSRYRELWKIEAAFRFNKHDLKMRPVYHWKKDRIEAPMVISYLTFAVGHFGAGRIEAVPQGKVRRNEGAVVRRLRGGAFTGGQRGGQEQGEGGQKPLCDSLTSGSRAAKDLRRDGNGASPDAFLSLVYNSKH